MVVYIYILAEKVLFAWDHNSLYMTWEGVGSVTEVEY